MIKALKWIAILLILGGVILFVYQNMERTPTLDTKGAYLSLDLYFFGLEQREPISLLWYFLGVFLLGMGTTKLFSLRKG